MSELWKYIPDYEDYYQASDWGRVRSLDREIVYSTGQRHFYHGQILKLCTVRSGHLQVSLSVNNKQKVQFVHQLVLKTFVGPCPAGYECCHNDGNPSNNKLSNLRWDTRSENKKDMYRHGYKSRSLKPIKRSDGMVFESIKSATQYMDVGHSAIQQSITRTGKCRGYKWEYV